MRPDQLCSTMPGLPAPSSIFASGLVANAKSERDGCQAADIFATNQPEQTSAMSYLREEIVMTSDEVQQAIDQMAQRIHAGITEPQKRVVIGIRRGGAVVARLLRDRLAQLQGVGFPIGFLDITFYRDDLDTVGPNPVVGATDLAMDIDDKSIILVDDILFTGRTIRAALNALFDFGRPEIVNLAVLVDRGHRQLPIQPDHTAKILETGCRESIKLVEKEAGRFVVVRRLRA
ncbi:MAG: bifunctional pyr operon transcriptional regulator/uracil phosphoribosyltransferase PyrR [Magnetococcales bacterium]|nr:bifunctional pyr operon transcriptional regulator/uracil phosphoribosyltransferase PyrR [Magnetococcales bacterium]